MNRGNMGKQISNAPKSKSKKVKKMFGGGMASMPMPGGMPPEGPPQGGAAASMLAQQAAARAKLGGQPEPMPGGGRSPIPVPPGLNRPMPMPMPMPGKPSIDGPGVRRPMPMPMPGKPGGGRPVQVKPPGGVRGTSGPKPAFGGLTRLMTKGGKVRGDGCCMKGHTKGAMR